MFLQPVKPTVLSWPWGPRVQRCRQQPPRQRVPPVACAGCAKGPWRHLFLEGIRDLACCPQSVSGLGGSPGEGRQWQPTPVPLPGESHGQRSLVGSSPWGRKESDTTEKLHFHFHKQCCYCCVNLSQHVNKQSVKLTTEFNILGKFHY